MEDQTDKPEEPTEKKEEAKERPERPRARPERPIPGSVDKARVEAVVSEDDVVERKRTLGQKFKALFKETDARGAVNYVIVEVLVPAARNMVIDSVTKGIERIVYPDQVAPGRRVYGPSTGSRVSYSNMAYRPRETRPPVGRGYVDTRAVEARPEDFYIFSSKRAAETVLENMGDIIEVSGVVSVADIKDLMGRRSPHTDNKWGWETLRGVNIQAVREGWEIVLPPPEPIN